MAYTVVPASTADIPDIVKVQDLAFEDDPVIGKMFPDVPPEEYRTYYTAYWKERIEKAYLTNSVFYKALDANGDFVGYAKWQYPFTPTDEQEAERRHSDETQEERLPLPDMANKPLMNEFFGKLRAKRDEYADESKDYCKGAGTALILKGLAEADRHNARAYIEASPAGFPLYKKFGWKEIDRVVTDMSKHGGDGITEEVLMMRDRIQP